MNFRVRGLSLEPFERLFGLGDEALLAEGARRFVADEHPGYPDRIEMREVPLGQTLLLVRHVSQPAATPYRASHAIFVWEGARRPYDAVNAIPEVMRRRLLSLRGFDAEGMMLEGDVVEGTAIEPMIAQFFRNPAVSTIHVHNAKRGCYSGLIERA